MALANAYTTPDELLAGFESEDTEKVEGIPVELTSWLELCINLLDGRELLERPELVSMCRQLVSVEANLSVPDEGMRAYASAVERFFGKILRDVADDDAIFLCTALKANGNPCPSRAANGFLTCKVAAHRNSASQLSFLTNAAGQGRQELFEDTKCFSCNQLARDHDSTEFYSCLTCSRGFMAECVRQRPADDTEAICSICMEEGRAPLAVLHSRLF